jgi:hypothetical protein
MSGIGRFAMGKGLIGPGAASNLSLSSLSLSFSSGLGFPVSGLSILTKEKDKE